MDNKAVYSSTPTTRWVARVSALIVLIGGCVSALGWIANLPRLADWEGNGRSIKFNTSLCLIALSLGLLLGSYYPRYRVTVRVLGALAVLIAAATIAQTILGVNFGIDTMFFNEAPGAPATFAPGRMGVPASTSFMLLGAALILATISRFRHVAAILSVTTLCIAALSLAGYAYGADQLYTLPRLTGIALQTAMMIAALAIGLVASVPEHGMAGAILRKDGGGIILRTTLPLLIVLVLLFGRLLLVGVMRGYYDAAFGTAILTLFEVVLLTSVLWWTARRVTQLETTSLAAADAIAKNQMHQRIADTQEAERKRIARDLHDDIGQEVTGVRFALAQLCDAKIEMPQMVAEVKAVCNKMEKLDVQLSNIAWQLRPPDLDRDGIVVSIRRLGMECTAIHEMNFDFHASSDLPGLPIETQTHIYRIVQESMNNIVKHAKASRIGITLDHINGDMRLAIEDDGVGFPEMHDPISSTDTGGFGLVGMRERAAIVSGTLEVETVRNGGTTVLLRIPLSDNHPSPASARQIQVLSTS